MADKKIEYFFTYKMIAKIFIKVKINIGSMCMYAIWLVIFLFIFDLNNVQILKKVN